MNKIKISLVIILLMSSIVNAQTYIPNCYLHKIGDASDNGYFAKAMKYLNDSGYQTITIAEYGLAREGKFTLPPKPIMITFDDGRDDAIKKGYPIMEKYGFKGMIAYPIDAPWYEPRLTWDDMRFLSSKGWEIGSHTNNDMNLLGDYAKYKNMSRITYQFAESKRRIFEEIGIMPEYFVFPTNNASQELIDECFKHYKYCSANRTNQDRRVVTINQTMIHGLGRAFCEEAELTPTQFQKRLNSTITGEENDKPIINTTCQTCVCEQAPTPDFKTSITLNGQKYEVWYIRK